MTDPKQRPIDLVLIGGGQANIQVVRLLKNVPGVNVTLVNDHTAGYYPGMLPGVLTGMYSEKELQVSMKELTAYGGARFILGRAVSIDEARSEVIITPVEAWKPHLSPQPDDAPKDPIPDKEATEEASGDSAENLPPTSETTEGASGDATPEDADKTQSEPESKQDGEPEEIRVHFDLISINVGSQTKASRSVPGVEENACTTRPLYRLMSKIEKFENAYFLSKDKERPTEVRICTIGAGMAGVELATALEKRFYEKFNAKVVSTIVSHLPLEGTMRCEKLGVKVHNSLKKKGFECIIGKKVAEVSPNHVVFTDGGEMDFDLMIWACGAEPPTLIHNIGEAGFIPVDPERGGYIKMTPALQSVSRLDVFGAGDCITIQQYPGMEKAGVMAVREGPILTNNLLESVKALQKALKSLQTSDPNIESEDWRQAKKKALEQCKPRLKRFKPKPHTLKLINMSDGTAIGGYKGRSFEGKLVLKLKDYIDRKWMSTFDDCGLGCD